MTTADRALLRQQLIDHEGLRLSAYQDSLGYWTIGVGRLIDRRRGGGLSREEAEFLLDHDIEDVVRGLTARLPWFDALDAVRQRALVDMGFNLGIAGLLKFTRTLAAIARQDYEAAAAAALQSKWATQVGPRRSGRIARMLATGEDA